MKRRTLLGTLAGSGAALAGCTGRGTGGPGDGGDGGSGTTTATATPTETETETTATPTTTAAPSVTERSFELGAIDCGTGRNDATVVIDGSTVSVDGVMRGSNGCARARLGAVDYADGTLTVAIESYSEGDVCKQCLVDMDYTATVRLRSPPERVVVTHDGEPVVETTARE